MEFWEWLADNWLALAALTLSVIVAASQAVTWFLRGERAFWTLDRFVIEDPMHSTPGHSPVGGRHARFTFRNAGNKNAYLTDVFVFTEEQEWRLYGERRRFTVRPEETVSIDLWGNLTQRLDVPQVWSSGDGFWFETGYRVRFTWTHRPMGIPLRRRQTFRLERRQLEAKIGFVRSLETEFPEP